VRSVLLLFGLVLICGLMLDLPRNANAQTGTATPVVNELAVTPTLSTTPVTVAIAGKVTSGTAGITLPSALTLTLNLVTTDVAGRIDAQTQNIAMQPDGTYRFDGVTVIPGTSIFVITTYEGVVQGSLVVQADNDTAMYDLPITLYAGTNDPAVVTLERAQYILDFKAGSEIGNVMQVLATYYYRNTSDRFFLAAEQTAQGKPISVNIPLPVGAQSIAFTNNVGTRYSIGGIPALPVIQDTRPVLPGQPHEIIVSYNVPYDKGAPIDQDYPFAVQRIEVLIPDDAGVRMQDKGEFTANPNISINPQRSYTQYNLSQPIKAGSRLIYTLEGIPPNQATAVPRPVTSEGGLVDYLPLILLAGAVVMAGVFVVVYLLRPKRGAK
jgi:hypothetical protein